MTLTSAAVASTNARPPAHAPNSVISDPDLCPKVGGLNAVCNVAAPEDLALLDSKWVIASSMATPARIVAISTSTRTVITLIDGHIEARWDRQAFPSCPGPVEPGSLSPHGISLSSSKDGKRILYAVNHGGREAVEIYEVSIANKPTAQWIGCVPMPHGTMGNAIAPLRDGSLVVTNFGKPAPDLMARIFRGEITGGLLVWRCDTGWRPLSATPMSGANGVDVSSDARYLLAAASGSRSLLWMDRLTGKQRHIQLDFIPDNVRADGKRMIVTGYFGKPESVKACLADHACRIDSIVVAFDTRTLRRTTLLKQLGSSGAGSFSTGLAVGQELWLGAIAGDRINIAPLDRPK